MGLLVCSGGPIHIHIHTRCLIGHEQVYRPLLLLISKLPSLIGSLRLLSARWNPSELWFVLNRNEYRCLVPFNLQGNLISLLLSLLEGALLDSSHCCSWLRLKLLLLLLLLLGMLSIHELVHTHSFA